MQDRCEWQCYGKSGEGECMGCSSGDEPLTLMPQLHEALEGWKPVCGQAYNLKDKRGKIFVFLLFLLLQLI